MKEFTIEPKADQRPDHRLANAIDDTAETIRGRIDHDRAHGVRPVKSPQKVGGRSMTRAPFGYTLLGASTVCFAFWSVTLNQVQYVGTLAFMGLQLCAACWMIVGVVKLINKVRQAFTFASYDIVDFVAGKKAPLVKSQPRTATGQFASKREVIHAALRRDVEAK